MPWKSKSITNEYFVKGNLVKLVNVAQNQSSVSPYYLAKLIFTLHALKYDLAGRFKYCQCQKRGGITSRTSLTDIRKRKGTERCLV